MVNLRSTAFSESPVRFLQYRDAGGGSMNTSSKRKMSTERDEAPRPMLTIREASRLLSVHSNTLRRWSAKGLIKEYRIGPGAHRRFKTEDVAALILEQPRYRQVKAGRLIRH